MENISSNVTNSMDINGTMEDIKSKLIDDVNVELELRGIKIETTKYDYGANIHGIITKYNQEKVKYDIERERIQARYSPNVQADKMAVLNTEFNLEVDGLLYDLDQVLQDDMKYRARQIEDMQANKHYLEAKKVSFDTLALLRGIDNVPQDIVEDIIGCMVEVGDVKALRLAQVLLGGDNTESGRRVGLALNKVRGQLEMCESKTFVNEAKKYINSQGKDVGVVLFGLMKKYDKR